MIKDVSEIDAIFSYFSTNNSSPKTELNYTNNYTLLVAVVLSAQSTDVGVNKATEKLFQTIKTPQDMINLGIDELKSHIRTIGLYNSKAKNIILLSQALIEQHDSQVPDDFESLIKLPGVGRKTANVILNCAFAKPTIAVDTHVYRVSKRIGLSSESNIIKLEEELLQNIPKKWQLHAHHWLILHGRYVCKARVPQCDICKIKQHCDYFKKHN